MTEALALQQVAQDLAFLKKKVVSIELELNELDYDFHTVKPSYLRKLEKIKKGKFHRYTSIDEMRKDLEG